MNTSKWWELDETGILSWEGNQMQPGRQTCPKADGKFLRPFPPTLQLIELALRRETQRPRRVKMTKSNVGFAHLTYNKMDPVFAL